MDYVDKFFHLYVQVQDGAVLWEDMANLNLVTPT